MRSSALSAALVVSLGAASLVAACGNPPAAEVPPPPPASSTMPGADKKPDAPPAGDKKPGPAAAGDKKPDVPPGMGEMPTFAPSKMGEMLKEAGLDINNLKPMKSMKTAEKSKVMKAMSASVGRECKDCHDLGDYKKQTPNKQIATHMWDEYVVPNKAAAGGPVFCDSCHQGKPKFLVKDKEVVKVWMDANMVKAIERKDKAEQACATCHTDVFEMKIIEKLWKIKR